MENGSSAWQLQLSASDFFRPWIALELAGAGFYSRAMKRIAFACLLCSLAATSTLRAQDAAAEERYNKLNGAIEDLIASQKAQQKQLNELAREISNLREQASKPNASYATEEDVKRLAEALKEVDRKRIEDAEKIHNELLHIGKSISQAAPPPPKKQKDKEKTEVIEKAKPSEKGYEYVVQKGDTLSIIAQTYRENKIKVTPEDIIKANPGLKAEKLRPGQKIFIPAPQS